MKSKYDDVDMLLNDIKSDMEDVLSKEVFDEARNIELEHIQMEVINRSTPAIYQRRTTGGIDDPNNIVGSVKNMTLTVDNVTQFNNGYGLKQVSYNFSTMLFVCYYDVYVKSIKLFLSAFHMQKKFFHWH